jgi:hypothetical protein
MKRSRPRQHIRRLKNGKKVVVNKGRRKAKSKKHVSWPKVKKEHSLVWTEDGFKQMTQKELDDSEDLTKNYGMGLYKDRKTDMTVEAFPLFKRSKEEPDKTNVVRRVVIKDGQGKTIAKQDDIELSVKDLDTSSSGDMLSAVKAGIIGGRDEYEREFDNAFVKRQGLHKIAKFGPEEKKWRKEKNIEIEED